MSPSTSSMPRSLLPTKERMALFKSRLNSIMSSKLEALDGLDKSGFKLTGKWRILMRQEFTSHSLAIQSLTRIGVLLPIDWSRTTEDSSP